MILIVKVSKISTPNPNSFKIKGCKSTFYIYPDNFSTILKNINDEIFKIRYDLNYNGCKFPDISFYFGKSQDNFIYIVSKIKININQPAEDLFYKAWFHFRPLLLLFYFFLKDIFSITKLYFFEKRSWGFKLIKILERPDYYKEVSPILPLKRFISVFDVEFVFPYILMRMARKEVYLNFIEGYINGKVKSFFIPVEIANCWNCLEHFANEYCKSKKKTKILKKKAINHLKKLIKRKIRSFNNKDIVFPHLTIEEIIEKGLLSPNNQVPIRNLIFYMFKRKRIKLSNEDKNLIKLMNRIRNSLYHEDVYLDQLAKRLNISLYDIALLTEKFSLLIERMILEFFKIVPNYYKLYQEKYYHKLKNKKIKLPSLREKNTLRKQSLKQGFDRMGLTEREQLIKDLTNSKKDLLRNGKYLSIIKFFTRFEEKLKKAFKDQYLRGTLKSSKFNKDVDIEIKFDENLRGSCKFLTTDKKIIYNITRVNTKYVSNKNQNFGNFKLEFVPFFNRISQVFNSSRTQSLPEGKFEIMSIEIKEIL
ncbi:MAG: hypothetical protein ACTSVV_07325 [Promethearchaeota archaeon]